MGGVVADLPRQGDQRQTWAEWDRGRLRGWRGTWEGVGATDLDEDAQDSQALWPLSRLTQGAIGLQIVMYDVQLRRQGINHLVSPRPPPKGSTLAATTAPSSMPYSWPTVGINPLSKTFPSVQILSFPGTDRARHCPGPSFTPVPPPLWLRC